MADRPRLVLSGAVPGRPRPVPRPSSAQPPAGPRFSIVIPARHDAAALGRALDHPAAFLEVGARPGAAPA